MVSRVYQMKSPKRSISQVQDQQRSSSSEEEEDILLSFFGKKVSSSSPNDSHKTACIPNKKKYLSRKGNYEHTSSIFISGNSSTNIDAKDESHSVLSISSRLDSNTDDTSALNILHNKIRSNHIIQDIRRSSETKIHCHNNGTDSEDDTPHDTSVDLEKYDAFSKEFNDLDQFLDHTLLSTITEEKRIQERERQNNVEVAQYGEKVRKIKLLSAKKCFRILDVNPNINGNASDIVCISDNKKIVGYDESELKYINSNIFSINSINNKYQSNGSVTYKAGLIINYIGAIVSTQNIKTVESISKSVSQNISSDCYNLFGNNIRSELIRQLKNLKIRQVILDNLMSGGFKIDNYLTPSLTKNENENDGLSSAVSSDLEDVSVIPGEDELFREIENSNNNISKNIYFSNLAHFENSSIYLFIKQLKALSNIVVQSYLSSKEENIGPSKRLLRKFIKFHFILLYEERTNYFGKRCIIEICNSLKVLISGYFSKNSDTSNLVDTHEVLELVLMFVNVTRSPKILFTLYKNISYLKPDYKSLQIDRIIAIFQTYLQVVIGAENVDTGIIIKSLTTNNFIELKSIFTNDFKKVIINIIFKQLIQMHADVLKLANCSFENDIDAESIQSLLAQQVNDKPIKNAYLERLIEVSEKVSANSGIYSNLVDDFDSIDTNKPDTESLIEHLNNFYSSINKFGTSPYFLLLKFVCLKSLVLNGLINGNTLIIWSKRNNVEAEPVKTSEDNTWKLEYALDSFNMIASVISRIADNYIPLNDISSDLNSTMVFLQAQKKLVFVKNLIDDLKKEYSVDEINY